MHRCPCRLLYLALIPCLTASAFGGDPQWVEIHSPNFSVVTDAGEKRGREVAMRFEQMRAVFGTLMTKANVNLPLPLQIVAFRNTREMRQIAPLFHGKPTELAGLFQNGGDRCFIMLDMSVENPWHVVFHEYAHQLLDGNMKAQFAPWFEEGFAEYFATIEVDGKQARVGRVPDEDYTILRQLGVMKVADLMRVQQNSSTYNESGDHRNTFYTESTMLMHYIYDNQLLPKVESYFNLTENKNVPVENAIEQAFGVKASRFDEALHGYIASGRYKYYAIPTPASISAGTYSARPMTVSDANTVIADIHLHSPDYREQGFNEFQAILKSDPNNAAACRGLGYAYMERRDFAQAAEYFRRASKLDSKDPRVHYYSAMLMSRENLLGEKPDLSEMRRELDTAIALDPNFADSYALLAFAQSASGDSASALVSMRKALAITPRNQVYLFNMANFYMGNHQPDEAVALLRSMRVTDNPMLAAQVSGALAEAQRMSEMMKDGEEFSDVPNIRRVDVYRDGEHKDVADEAKAIATPVKPRPAKFLKGTLMGADCTAPPAAVLTVVSGSSTWKMKVSDRKSLILIGADSFSCEWSKKKVAVNYVETADSEGNVISLEIQ